MNIYALLDYDVLNQKEWSIEKFVRKCKSLNVKIIQYRDKKGSIKRKQQNLQRIKSLCDITLIVNDSIELAKFCDGLHLGQEDLANLASTKKEAIHKVRAKIGKKILGISTHNKEEIKEANELDIDYIGLGAYRATSTKGDATVLKERLDELASLSFKPVGAIGGVKLNDVIENVTYLVVGSDIYEH